MKTKPRRISKNTNYKRGRNLEYRVKKYYEKMGYYVKRSYASKGAEDLIAIKSAKYSLSYDPNFPNFSEVLLIQCKNTKVERKALSKTESENLKRLALITGGKPLYVYNNSKHRLVVREIV